MGIKLNIGASPIWESSDWLILDHKLKESTDSCIAGDALSIDLPDNSCDLVFASHIFEHVPHTKLPLICAEINRVLAPGGVIRLLTPDLERIAKAYIEKDVDFFKLAKEEDETIREDLGFGGMLMNFIVSPGQDTVLINRNLNEFIAGYAHLYSYDYTMLSTILNTLGFIVERKEFCESAYPDFNHPLHVVGHPPEWHPLNQSFYDRHGLVHKLVDGQYVINFRITGFDRDPHTSLIIEARKDHHVSKITADKIFNLGTNNYNRYSRSLLINQEFTNKLSSKEIKY